MLQNFIVASDSKQIMNDIARGCNEVYAIHYCRNQIYNDAFILEGSVAYVDVDRLAKFSHSLNQG